MGHFVPRDLGERMIYELVMDDLGDERAARALVREYRAAQRWRSSAGLAATPPASGAWRACRRRSRRHDLRMALDTCCRAW